MKLKTPSRSAQSGLTLIEMLVTMGVFVIFAGYSIAGLLQMNRVAAAAKLQTLALAVAQQRIDEFLTATPWSRKNERAGLPGARAPILLPTSPSTPPAQLSPTAGDPILLNDDPTNSSIASSLDQAVQARRYTYVQAVGDRSVRATVIVEYTFRGRKYNVKLTSLRTSNDI